MLGPELPWSIHAGGRIARSILTILGIQSVHYGHKLHAPGLIRSDEEGALHAPGAADTTMRCVHVVVRHDGRLDHGAASAPIQTGTARPSKLGVSPLTCRRRLQCWG